MTIKESNNFFTKTIDSVKLLEEKESSYQKIGVYTNDFWGNIMTLDGISSISSNCSYKFYESSVQTALCTHPDAKRVLVIGGGNGAMAYEILKHKDIEAIDVVEIDDSIIEMSKKYFSQTASSLEEKRVNLVFGNGYDFARDAEDKSYDVILVDTVDALGGESNFDKIFFAHASRILKDKGILITRAENITFDFEKYKSRLKTVSEFFRFSIPFKANDALSLSGSISLIYASKKFHPTADLLLQKIDMLDGLKYYNPEIHNANFAIGSDEFKNLLDAMKL